MKRFAVLAAIFAVALTLFAGAAGANDTAVSLRDYLEIRIEEQDRRVEQAQQSARAAVEKAEAAIGERLILLNEFRAQSADQASKYITRPELDALMQRITQLEQSRDRVYGGILIVALIGVVNLVKLFWGEK